jgi:hypothetical protein
MGIKKLNMKKLLVCLMILLSSSVIAQKIITYEEMKTITKGTFEQIDCNVYVAKDGHSYKIGDTLKIGRPSINKTFAYINESAGFTELKPASISISSNNSVLKRIYVGGTKRTGFHMMVIGKGMCALCPQYYIDFEDAIATGELQSFGMSREQAIAKLKEAKDLVDLGMMSKEDFEKLKADLTPLIIKQ